MGAELVRVHFNADGVFPELLPKTTYERLVSAEPVELTLLRELRYKPLIDNLTQVMMEYDVKFSDLGYVGKALVNKIEDAFERASNYLWTKNDATWTPGVDYRSDRTILEAEAVLKTARDTANEQAKTGNN